MYIANGEDGGSEQRIEIEPSKEVIPLMSAMISSAASISSSVLAGDRTISNRNFKKYLPQTVCNTINSVFVDQNTWSSLSPQPHAKEFLDIMRDEGAKIYFLTATDPINAGWKYEWMQKHFDISLNEFVVIQDKWRFDADIIIDDRLETLKKCALMHRICFDKPWNQQSEERDEIMGIWRAKDWGEVYEAVQAIAKLESEEN